MDGRLTLRKGTKEAKKRMVLWAEEIVGGSVSPELGLS